MSQSCIPELMNERKLLVSFNPYSPPPNQSLPSDSHANQSNVQRRPVIAVLRSLPFSVAAGLVASAVWALGTTVLKLTLLQMHALLGLSLGCAICSSLVSIGVCGKLPMPSRCLRLMIVILGCTIGASITPITYNAYRSAGWHITGMQYPWIWAISTELPNLIGVLTISSSLFIVRFVSITNALRITALGIVWSMLCLGAIDHLLRPDNSITAHLIVRAILLMIWVISVTGTIVFVAASQNPCVKSECAPATGSATREPSP